MAGPAVKTKKASAARRAALAALAAVAAGTKLDAALERAARMMPARRDVSFAEELTKAVVRHGCFLDFQLEAATEKPLEKITPVIRDVLRIGAAEIFLMRTPPYAAVDEAVALAAASRYAGLAPFVNAVLRRLAAWGAPRDAEGDATTRLAITYSFPDWLVSRWLARFGAAEAEALCAALNAPAPLTVYANPARATKDELIAAFAGAGIPVTEGAFGSLEISLGDARMVGAPGYAEGTFVVLDPASTLGPRWLGPPPGATVVDLCAGVGGKSFQLAGLVGEEGRVIALDASAYNLRKLEAGARRLGLNNIEARRADVLRDELPPADYVFLDAPCTNLGVIRHKPDIKWRVREEDVAAAAGVQTEMLRRAAAALKPSGRLFYYVCTMEPEETTGVVETVIGERGDLRFGPCPVDVFGDARAGPYLWTWPQRHRCNGGFGAPIAKAA